MPKFTTPELKSITVWGLVQGHAQPQLFEPALYLHINNVKVYSVIIVHIL